MSKLNGIKPGDDVTIISKGIRHPTYGKPYIDTDLVGRTFFMRVTKIGTGYIYGNSIYFEEGQRRENTFETRDSIEENLIFPGIHQQFQAQFNVYRLACEEYEKKYRHVEYDISRKYDELKSQEINAWRKNNPRPTQKIEDYHLKGVNA